VALGGENNKSLQTSSQLGVARMMRWLLFTICFHFGLTLFACRADAAEPIAVPNKEHIEFFEKRVRPLLAKHCYECHGEKKQESGLRLDARATILRGGETGDAGAIPGEPTKSLIISAIGYEGDVQMPPAGKLSAEEIADLTHWVKLGLPWPEGETSPTPLTARERVSDHLQKHWSFQPIQKPAMPKLEGDHGLEIQNPIDAYVLAKLNAKGLSLSPPSDRRTLLRRLSFDLLGLPPTEAEVEAFLADVRPDAVSRVVDRMLASPAFGERWGRHWLDVARYSDTKGYAFGQERRFPYAYTYRDYVVDAFNNDKPYDEFILDQLAADHLGLPSDSKRLAALGFLTVGRQYQRDELIIDDQIDVVGRGLLGLTIACARCHDHKYDAIPTVDYYSLYGVFASSKPPKELPAIGDPHDTPGYEAFAKQLAIRRAAIETFHKNNHRKIVETARTEVTDYLVRAVHLGDQDALRGLPFIKLKPDDARKHIVNAWRHTVLKAQPNDPILGPLRAFGLLKDSEFAKEAPLLKKKYAALPQGLKPGEVHPLIANAISNSSLTSKIEVAHAVGAVFDAASQQWKKLGGNEEAFSKLTTEQQALVSLLRGTDSPTYIPLESIQRHYHRAEREEQKKLQKRVDEYIVSAPGAPPRAMSLEANATPYDSRIFIRGDANRRGDRAPRRFLELLSNENRPTYASDGRLEVAQAIVAKDNPLTARVIANRIWMHHFGKPLVATPSDFGIQCAPPVQRELLDYLASFLIENDWSLKALHREILLSATYQQSSVYRDDAAKIDPENLLLWRMNRRRVEYEVLRDALLAVSGELDPQLGGKPVEMFDAPNVRRRSIYGLIDRQDLPGILRTFDFASPDQSTAQRPKTITPQQALAFMNSPFVLKRVDAIVAKLPADEAGPRIAKLYATVFQRLPTEPEKRIALALIQQTDGKEDSASEIDNWKLLTQTLLMSNEFIYID